MRGWIFFPEKQKPRLLQRFPYIPGLDLPDGSDGDAEETAEQPTGRIQGASLGFIRGPAAGDASPVYPSLLEGVLKYPRSEYKPRFQPTRKIWEILPPVTIKPAERQPDFLWTAKTFQAPYIVVNGSFPRMMADLFVRECRTFRFRPYILK